jgi:hypothetical protein
MPECRMNYRYCICDVFTETRFDGNQFAVLPEEIGLTAGLGPNKSLAFRPVLTQEARRESGTFPEEGISIL